MFTFNLVLCYTNIKIAENPIVCIIKKLVVRKWRN